MTASSLDSTLRFGPRAAAYARARPGYPDAVVDQLARVTKLAIGSVIVDLGCGTGLSSEPFLRAGFRVIGIEPNEAMRSHANRRLSAQSGFAAIDGRAESTNLNAACADLVIAAQAFHWFDVAATRTEALRILRRPALAALIWNDRRTQGSEFARGFESLLLGCSAEYVEVRHRHARVDRVEQFFGNGHWDSITVAHSDELDFDMLADRLNSASYVPAPGEPQHAPMMERLRELFVATARDGMVTMEFDTRVWYGDLEAALVGQTRRSEPPPGPPL